MIDNITDQQYQEAFDELAKYENQIYEEFQKALEYYKDNSILTREQLEDNDYDDAQDFNFDDGTFQHIGYCNVELTDHTNCFYPNHKFYSPIKADRARLNLPQYFMRQDRGIFHELVWQSVGYCEDDYSGYLLFPMKDGRYWAIYFTDI